MSKHPIAVTHNGTAVYVDLVTSRVSGYIAQQPHVLTLIKELIAALSVTEATATFEYDFGRPIGNTDIITTTEKDSIVYAKQPKQDVYTRFVRRRLPTPSNHITIILRKDSAGDYELQDAWIGRLAPPRPGSSNETSQSRDFWATHAVILEGQNIQARTLTKECPY
jgi:hypothetical protein